MSPNPADSGYVEVPERIAEFRQKHPDGSLQADVIKWPDNGFGFIVVRARCFRAPDDPRPGIGWAQEPFPGKTPFTKDSELQNAETSAWGRAIIAALAADAKRGIASKEEIEARRQDQQASRRTPPGPQAKREAATRTTPPSEGQVSGAVADSRGENGKQQEKAAPESSGPSPETPGGDRAGAAIDSPTPPPGPTSEGEEAASGVDTPPLSDFDPDAKASKDQLDRIKKAYGGPTSAGRTAHDTYGVAGLKDLTAGQAKEMLEAKFR